VRSSRAGDNSSYPLAGQALTGDDGGGRGLGRLGGLVLELCLACSRSPNTLGRPGRTRAGVAGAADQQLGAPLPARVAGAYALGPPSHTGQSAWAVMTNLAARHGVASISRSSSAEPGVWPSATAARPPQRRAALNRWLYSIAPSTGKQCPTCLAARAAMPLVVIVAAGTLRHRQGTPARASSLLSADPARTGPGRAKE